MSQTILHHSFNDSGIDANQLLTRHSWLTWNTTCNHNHITSSGLGVIICTTRDTRVKPIKGRRLHQIQGFSLGEVFLDV